MSAPHWVIVDGDYEGFIVEGEPRYAQFQGVGYRMLPVDVAALRAGGAQGATAYQRRSYPALARFDGDRFARACPLPVFLPLGVARVAWVAALAFEPDSHGQLHLAADAVPSGPSAEVRVETETLCDPLNELATASPQGMPSPSTAQLFRGTAVVRAVPNAWAVLCLAGACAGVRVAWFSLTVLPP